MKSTLWITCDTALSACNWAVPRQRRAHPAPCEEGGWARSGRAVGLFAALFIVINAKSSPNRWWFGGSVGSSLSVGMWSCWLCGCRGWVLLGFMGWDTGEGGFWVLPNSSGGNAPVSLQDPASVITPPNRTRGKDLFSEPLNFGCNWATPKIFSPLHRPTTWLRLAQFGDPLK